MSVEYSLANLNGLLMLIEEVKRQINREIQS